MDLLGDGADLMKGLRESYGHTVSYETAHGSVDVKATLGHSDLEDDKIGMGIIISRTTDFLINAASLIINGAVVEPSINDIIHSNHSGTLKSYRVTPDSGDACFVPHDNRGEVFRIHTKEIEQ